MCYVCDALAPICRWRAKRALRSIELAYFNHTSSSEDASDSDLSLCGACETDGGRWSQRRAAPWASETERYGAPHSHTKRVQRRQGLLRGLRGDAHRQRSKLRPKPKTALGGAAYSFACAFCTGFIALLLLPGCEWPGVYSRGR